MTANRPVILAVDFDDTLVSAEPHWINIYSECLARHLPVGSADIAGFRDYLGANRGATLGDFAAKFSAVTGITVDTSVRILQADLEQAYDHGSFTLAGPACAITDVALRLGVETYILTGGLAAHKRRILRGLGRPDYANLVTGFGDIHFTGKIPWLENLRRQRPQTRIVVVGDGTIDCDAARAVNGFFVGVGSIACDWPVETFQFEEWLAAR